MTLQVSRKGDLIELGAGGAYRLEQAVLVAPNGDEARHPTLAEEATDEETPSRPWKLTRRVDTNGTTPDADGNEQPTAYTYRYDPVAEFMADDEEAAIKEARRLISERG
jgi:hypothetical protein